MHKTWNHKTQALQMLTWIRKTFLKMKHRHRLQQPSTDFFLSFCLACLLVFFRSLTGVYFEISFFCSYNHFVVAKALTHKPKAIHDVFRRELKSFLRCENGEWKHSVSMVFCVHVDVFVVLDIKKICCSLDRSN